MSKITPIKQDKFAQTVAEMRDKMPSYLEFVELDAKIRRAKYKALIAEGFTPDQALELTKDKII
ncbi:MAG: hypothetical protein ACSHWQ_00050 [Spongiibacteraceae bacterium]